MSDNTDSLKKLLLLIQQFTPFMLIWYFILYSIFNNTLSGITMVFGMIFTSFFCQKRLALSKFENILFLITIIVMLYLLA